VIAQVIHSEDTFSYHSMKCITLYQLMHQIFYNISTNYSTCMFFLLKHTGIKATRPNSKNTGTSYNSLLTQKRRSTAHILMLHYKTRGRGKIIIRHTIFYQQTQITLPHITLPGISLLSDDGLKSAFAYYKQQQKGVTT